MMRVPIGALSIIRQIILDCECQVCYWFDKTHLCKDFADKNLRSGTAALQLRDSVFPVFSGNGEW